mmetsp:Transcript_5401/g.10143  ORF Transcript_5401/g.10143 Transcript_5401/m.10143 type:complete len:226 (-) Transcript_5401:198-875(-)
MVVGQQGCGGSHLLYRDTRCVCQMTFFWGNYGVCILFCSGKSTTHGHRSNHQWTNQTINVDPSVVLVKHGCRILPQYVLEDFNPSRMIRQIRSNIVHASPQNDPCIVILVVSFDFFQWNVPPWWLSLQLGKVFGGRQETLPVVQPKPWTTGTYIDGSLSGDGGGSMLLLGLGGSVGKPWRRHGRVVHFSIDHGSRRGHDDFLRIAIVLFALLFFLQHGSAVLYSE